MLDTDRPDTSAAGLLAARASPAVLAALFVAMLAFSWGTWPDVMVDFGTELYTAWQLADGKVLGRDVFTSATGPPSPYLNALAFRIFGTSLRTLVVLNLAILVCITSVLHALLREIGDRFAATLATAFFLAVFAFGQYVGIGNYNYVTPYSHGTTHGMLLSLLAIALLWRHSRTGALRDLAASSAALGLVFLTKPEFFVACAGAVGCMFALRLRDRPDPRVLLRWSAALAIPALVPALLAFALLAIRADAGSAWRTTFAPWIAMGTPVTQTPFYLSGLGLDEPWANATRAGAWLAAGLAVFASTALADVVARRFSRTRAATVGAAALAGAAAGAAAWTLVPLPAWYDVARPLPAVAAAICAAALASAWRGPRPCPPASLLTAGFSVFSLLLLLKMALNARLYHYGFVLAAPATLLLIAWLAATVPRLLRARNGSGLVFRLVTLAVVTVVAGAYLRFADMAFSRKTVTVGSGADRFRADVRGAFVNEMVARISRSAPPWATLAVLPEGVMINYLTRRPNPTPYLTYLPDGIALLGEARLLAPYRARPPDLIVVAHRDATEHGAAFFGIDYARDTLRWMSRHYEPVGTVGTSPFQASGYGLMLLRRTDGS